MKQWDREKRVLLVGLCLVAVVVLAGAANEAFPPASTAEGQSRTLLPDGRWLFVGGAGAEGPMATATVWDPHTDVLTPTRDAPHFARAWHTATVLPDGSVLLVGGVGGDGAIVATAEVFFADTQSFTPLVIGSLTPRAFHSATLLTDGRVLIAGGRTTTAEVLATAEVWDPRTLTSTVAAGVMQAARERHEAVLRKR